MLLNQTFLHELFNVSISTGPIHKLKKHNIHVHCFLNVSFSRKWSMHRQVSLTNWQNPNIKVFDSLLFKSVIFIWRIYYKYTNRTDSLNERNLILKYSVYLPFKCVIFTWSVHREVRFTNKYNPNIRFISCVIFTWRF